MGTLLLGALKDEAETVQVTFLGRGPLGQMTTIASGLGFVKGFVGDPLCNPPLKPNGKLDVGAAVGPGILTVVRNHRNWKQPYTGTVPIYSGEVAEDIAHYLADSEQINTAMGLGVTFGKDSVVKSAHGYLVQVLPFCSEATLIKLEENVQRMLPLADISEDSYANSIVEFLLHGIGIGDFSDPVVPHFRPCGVQELKPRMIQAVASLGPSDIQKLLKEQGSVEVKCEFCAEVVRFEENDLEHILHPAS
ncbi:hypothetical protein O6H91_03G112900 [Diphasiastrum complanatum]|uniref:Uncharacterized protein n=1 Tax=Diphasiastrum complanatum TaxID=34168 RepID=A0ACC2EAR1_DIPCM|nr:hypothetical protein O6H91_03G112900 [Diphasiastrum complanatum]